MEWKDENWFNSFNSAKGLLYADWYKAIVEGKLKPPIEASIDPVHNCNLNCIWCNAQSYLTNTPRRMPRWHLTRLTAFLVNWGVKGFCYGGGGEPTLHPESAFAPQILKHFGAEYSFATNGLYWTEDMINTLSEARWVGVSVDAGDAETYAKCKRTSIDNFLVVLKNIRKLLDLVKKKKTNCEVAFKFLIFPDNQQTIFEACKIAKDLGVRDFHARPAATDNLLSTKIDFNLNLIDEEFEKCHKLETEDFRVFTVRHKFTKDFHKKDDFKHCWAAPLSIQCCADGNVYLCVDQRLKPRFKLGSHYPNPNNIISFWGNKYHLNLMKSINPAECGRCTYGIYAKQIEELFTGKDPMCVNFP